MKLRMALAAVLLTLSNSSALDMKLESSNENFFNKALRNLEKISRFELSVFNIDIKKRRISYNSHPNLYFYLKQDHNGKPLYVLEYSLHLEDVPAYIKRLQRTLQ